MSEVRFAKGKGVSKGKVNFTLTKDPPVRDVEEVRKAQERARLRRTLEERWFTRTPRLEWGKSSTTFPDGEGDDELIRKMETFPHGTRVSKEGGEEVEYLERPPLKEVDHDLLDCFWAKPTEIRNQMFSTL